MSRVVLKGIRGVLAVLVVIVVIAGVADALSGGGDDTAQSSAVDTVEMEQSVGAQTGGLVDCAKLDDDRYSCTVRQETGETQLVDVECGEIDCVYRTHTVEYLDPVQ